jgi:hypothetical protein
MEAMVSKPNGGCTAFFDMNFRACLKLQKVSGYLGYTSSTFIYSSCRKVFSGSTMFEFLW